LGQARARFAADPAAAERLLAQAALTEDRAGISPADLAAWTVVANVLLNLDEALTKG
jgi:hypothetical protein